jgi:hypothetical protein
LPGHFSGRSSEPDQAASDFMISLRGGKTFEIAFDDLTQFLTQATIVLGRASRPRSLPSRSPVQRGNDELHHESSKSLNQLRRDSMPGSDAVEQG